MEDAKRARYGVKRPAFWFVQVRLQPYGLVAAMGRVDQMASACTYTSADALSSPSSRLWRHSTPNLS